MLALSQRLFTSDEYHAMGRAGIFTEDDRVELMDGQILAMAPIGSRHFYCVNELNRLFAERLYRPGVAPQAIVSVQNPIRLSERTEPQPDVVLYRADADREKLPGSDDVLLLNEVADTSLDYDMEAKVPRYAAAGVPEVWVVDLEEEAVHVFRKPSRGAYEQHVVKAAGDLLDVEILPEVSSFQVRALFW